MGNKLGKRRQVVEDKYTRPQGLYEIKDVDYKKLRKLILESKLAPCYPGGDECDSNHLEECPICFLYYPTLNRSRCCTKGICTECFLQMKNPGSTRPTQCPFCKTSNYAVEYRGMKSKEERGLEEIEEQKVIEAKIRMRQQELLEEEERQQRKAEIGSSNREEQTGNPDCSPSSGLESEEITSCQDSRATQIFSPQIARQNRDGELDLDLEDIMVMEAIWLSMQENGRAGHSSAGDVLPEQYATSISPPPASSSSPSGGLACAIAALAERQQLNSELSHNYNGGGHVSPSDMLPSTSRSTNYNKRVKKSQRNRPHSSSSAKEMMYSGASEVTEVGTSSDDFEAGPSSPPPPPQQRRPKRVKNDQRKHASLEIASNLGCDYGMAGTSYGSSDESDEEGHWTTMLPPPPPYDEPAVPPLPPCPPPSLLLLHGGGANPSSKRVKNDRKRYSLRRRASSKNTTTGGEMVSADDWEADYGSVVAEAGTTHYGGSSCNESDEPLYDSDDGGYMALPPPPPPLPSSYGWWHPAISSPVVES